MVHIMTSLISTTLIMCLAFTVQDGSDALLCDRAKFDYSMHNHCVSIYEKLMTSVNYQDKCPWPSTKSHYYNLNNCFERVADITGCNEPSLKNKIFLELHNTYFSHCSFLKDPSVPVLLLFTLPCIIITFVLPLVCSLVTNKE